MFYFGWKFETQSTGPTSSCILFESHFGSYLVYPGDVMQQIISSGAKFKCGLTVIFWVLGFCYCYNMILKYADQKDLKKIFTNSTSMKSLSSFPKV